MHSVEEPLGNLRSQGVENQNTRQSPEGDDRDVGQAEPKRWVSGRLLVLLSRCHSATRHTLVTVVSGHQTHYSCSSPLTYSCCAVGSKNQPPDFSFLHAITGVRTQPQGVTGAFRLCPSPSVRNRVHPGGRPSRKTRSRSGHRASGPTCYHKRDRVLPVRRLQQRRRPNGERGAKLVHVR